MTELPPRGANQLIQQFIAAPRTLEHIHATRQPFRKLHHIWATISGASRPTLHPVLSDQRRASSRSLGADKLPKLVGVGSVDTLARPTIDGGEVGGVSFSYVSTHDN